ncbi:MAG: TatD family hydrolase [Promethearchaeota archaeon]
MSKILIDCHCHLEEEEFDKDRKEVIERARNAGVLMITSGVGLEYAEKALKIASEFEDVYACAGFGPYDTEDPSNVIEFIRKNKNKLVGIGEVGLDFWWVKEQDKRDITKKNFLKFINLGNELEIPLIIHSRSAGRQTIEILIQENAQMVQMHAFDGKASYAMKGVEKGFMFSIPTSVVRSAQKQKLVKRLPIENLLLETDSPVLGVDPKSRNEPCFLIEGAKKIAEIKSISLEKIIDKTTNNAKDLFKLIKLS